MATSTIRDGDISGCSTKYESTAISAFRGNSGISSLAARSDHSHPVNVDPSVVPPPVGLLALTDSQSRSISNEKAQSTYGVGGYPHIDNMNCNTYALGNHSHAYSYINTWGYNSGLMITGSGVLSDICYALPDGCVASSLFSQIGRYGARRESGTVVRSSVRQGNAGSSPFPAREDHSHALNLIDVVNTAAKAEDNVKRDKPDAVFGTSSFYARLDHVHPLSKEGTPTNLSPSPVYDTTSNRKTNTWNNNTENGFKILALSRIVRTGDYERAFYFRELTIGAGGNIVSVSEEKGASGVFGIYA